MRVQKFLYVIIFIGLVFRFFYPFFSNPLDHLYSDPNRHHFNALPENMGITLFSILDPPLPQFILRAALFVLGDSVFGEAAYFGVLCAITPWCWYRWGRLIFASKTIALIFMAVITYLPSWISIYSYVQDEPLLLPSLGIALWLSWRAKNKMTTKAVLLATLAWAFTFSIKMNVAFELLIVITWLLITFYRQSNNKRKAAYTTMLVGFILALTYMSYPLWVYKGLGFTWLFPPGIGALNRGWYMSNAIEYSAAIIYKGQTLQQTGSFGSNGTCSQPFSPFSDWSTWRSGHYNYEIKCDEPVTLVLPCGTLTWKERLRNMAEEALHFFFCQSWPDARDDDPVQKAQILMRWVWFFLTLGIIVLALLKKQLNNILTILCLGTLLFYLLNNCSMIDGRYRKPWEGIAIATFIYLCTVPSTRAPKKKHV